MKQSNIKTPTLILIILMSAMNLFGQNAYNSLWKNVDQFNEGGQPREALKATQGIFDKAVKEKNFPQMMKSWIRIIENKADIDPDSFNIDQFPKIDYKGPVQTALYNTIMGSAYENKYRSMNHAFDEETLEKGTAKAKEFYLKALEDKENLAAANAKEYEPMTETHEDGKIYNHDMLYVLTDFITDRGTSLSDNEKISILAETANFYKSKGNKDGWALLTIKRLNMLRALPQNNGDKLSHAALTDSIKALLNECKGLEVEPDIANEYLSTLLGEEERLAFARISAEKYANSHLARLFKYEAEQIMQPSCAIQDNGIKPIIANKPFKVKINYRNTTNARITVRKYNGKTNNKLRTDGKIVLQKDVELGKDSTNTTRRMKNLPTSGNEETELTLGAGRYVVVIDAAGTTNATELQITSLQMVCLELPNNMLKVFVVNNSTGRPIPNAKLSFRRVNHKEDEKAVCDANGEYIIDNGNQVRTVRAYLSDDDELTTQLPYYVNDNSEKTNNKEQINLFTDRAIYRPGHVIHVSGLVYNADGDNTKVVNNYATTITLIDSNGEEVGKEDVTTNEYGSFSTDFTIPKDRLPGTFRLQGKNGGVTTFKVEEYKRPTFTVECKGEETDKEFTFGDTVIVNALAKTYSGVPVQDAKVKYTIETRERVFGRFGGNYWEKLSEGELSTDADGNAAIPMVLSLQELDDFDDKNDLDKVFDELYSSESVIDFRVTADVTDLAGETQSNSRIVSISKLAFVLEIPDMKIYNNLDDNPSFTIIAKNANNTEISVEGKYAFCSAGDKVEYEGTFVSGQAIKYPSLPGGRYTIKATAYDKNGHKIEKATPVILYSKKEAVELLGKAKPAPSKFENQSLLSCDRYFSETKPAEIYVSIPGDAYTYYYILSKDKVIESKAIELSGGLYHVSVPYKKEYGENVELHIFYAKDGMAEHLSHLIERELPEKNLKLTWSTFRDRLTPGQDEEWVLSVKDKDGKAVDGAELLATMYDASLDHFTRHSWPFYVNFKRNLKYFSFSRNWQSIHLWLNVQGNLRYPQIKEREFDILAEYINPSFGRFARPLMMAKARGAVNSLKEVAVMEKTGSEESIAVDASLQGRIAGLDIVQASTTLSESPIKIREEVHEGDIISGIPGDADIPVAAIRTNFNETAFFYPNILTDANGDAHISFTLPETLTEWKFLGFVHTKDVEFGRIESTVVARKEFMVQPNMPRFVREGDKATITSRIINQTDKAIAGKAYIKIMDADSEAVVYVAEQPFNVDANATTSATFSFPATDKYPMLVCEVTGVSEGYSDGERNYLPVVSSKKYITETIPFFIDRVSGDGSQEKTIDLSPLFNSGSKTATQKRMNLEYTANPVWTVIEALEGIKVADESNAPCFAASLYANTLAQKIAGQIPGLEEYVTRYKANHTDGDGYASTLENDESLKDILLSATPWLRDAMKEENQRRELVDLFDEGMMNQRISKAKDKLAGLQNEDGSWSWFEGMEGSYYITLSVCENLAQLHNIDGGDYGLAKALKYLDNEELKSYKEKKLHKWSLTPSESTLHYLYTCAMMPEREVGKEVQQMRETYLKQIEGDIKNLTIYGRANASYILLAFGRDKSAKKFLQSAMEYSVHKEGMGRYYATDRALYSWMDYRIPTQLAVMNTLQKSRTNPALSLEIEGAKDKDMALLQMEQWLMRQKQTQTWDNPINTVNAVSFLVNESQQTGQAIGQGASFPAFSIDGNAIPMTADTTLFMADVIGYGKVKVDDAVVNKGVKVLNITQHEVLPLREDLGGALATISWGSVYAQYLEDMDRLKNQTSGELSVERKIYVGDSKKEYNPEKDEPLKIGDKVRVRIIVKADRDMDFVAVKSQIPACFESVSQRSGYQWMGGRGGYLALHDASSDVFFDRFTKGTATVDLEYYVTRSGEYLSGIATVQCMYAPEFGGHTKSERIRVE